MLKNKKDLVIASCGNDGNIILAHSEKAEHLLTLKDNDDQKVIIGNYFYFKIIYRII